jgi:hypothetical protein
MITTQTGFRYALAVLILGGSAMAMQAAKSRGVFRLVKLPLPVRKALEDADRACVRPFTVQASRRLPPETVEELGTSEYLDWVLQGSAGAVKWQTAELTVTYYTGVQDQVPHVPEECFYQGAFTPDTDRTIEADMERLGRQLSIRRLSFYPPPGRSGGKVYVYYTICVNGDFYSERNRVRLRMGDPRESHMYYSKVELVLDGVSDNQVQEADRQAFELLDGVLVELVGSHWPKIEAGAGVASGK